MPQIQVKYMLEKNSSPLLEIPINILPIVILYFDTRMQSFLHKTKTQLNLKGCTLKPIEVQIKRIFLFHKFLITSLIAFLVIADGGEKKSRYGQLTG